MSTVFVCRSDFAVAHSTAVWLDSNDVNCTGSFAGFLDSHNLAQFGVPEHVLQAIKPHSQQNQDTRSMH